MDESLLNETLQGIREMLKVTSITNSQNSAVSINFIKVPEFRGKPDEDVYDFLKSYNIATSMLTDQQKCLSLKRALLGPAAIWAKNIEQFCSDGHWTQAEKAIKERFGPADSNLRLREKLSRMKYDPSTSTLQSYIEIYEDRFKKAFGDHEQKEIIQALRINLPHSIIKGLNTLDDSWSNYQEMSQLYTLIKRYQANIQPYEKNEDQSSKHIDKEGLSNMLNEFKKNIISEITKTQDQQNHSLAIMSHQAPNKEINADKFRYDHNNLRGSKRKYLEGYKGHKRNYNTPINHCNDRNYVRFNEKHNETIPVTDNQKLNNNTSRQAISGPEQPNANVQYRPNRTDPTQEYFAKHGIPPGPCYHCQGNHFNRHCPFIRNDLN